MNKTISIFMPLRLNSKRIKNKNIIKIFNRPLFCWSLSTLDKLDLPVYVYTSDCEIFKKCLDFKTKNINFLHRPEKLDGDNILGIAIYREFANTIDTDVYLLAHCTSPFVKMSTYKRLIEGVVNLGYDCSCTVDKKQTFSWYDKKQLNFILPRTKTQNIKPVYIETSAAYCYNKQVIQTCDRTNDNLLFIETKGLESLDIDTPEDLKIIEDIKKYGNY